MTKREIINERIKLLELAISDSLDRTNGSINQQSREDQAIKRREWRTEIEQKLKELNDLDNQEN